MAGGRPSSYSPELAEAICERLAKGEPLARICESDDMPCFSTVWRWERDNDEFRKLSAHAREIGTHYIADDCIRISDTAGMEPADKRVRIDTRLRLIGKWNAKKYGERQTIEHEGSINALSDAELDARIAAAMAALGDEQG